jgi:hypothetical protein
MTQYNQFSSIQDSYGVLIKWCEDNYAIKLNSTENKQGLTVDVYSCKGKTFLVTRSESGFEIYIPASTDLSLTTTIEQLEKYIKGE